jgi:UDP-N-acetylmuramoyl-tripeptide--D-alanyl-D-alanine ligase
VGVDFETELVGRHAVMNLLAAIAVARDLASRRRVCGSRSAPSPPARCAGEAQLEHNGILVWNDCYNSNPEAAQSMIDVLGETPAATALRCWERCWNWGTPPKQLHRQVGRMRPEHGVDC